MNLYTVYSLTLHQYQLIGTIYMATLFTFDYVHYSGIQKLRKNKNDKTETIIMHNGHRSMTDRNTVPPVILHNIHMSNYQSNSQGRSSCQCQHYVKWLQGLWTDVSMPPITVTLGKMNKTKLYFGLKQFKSFKKNDTSSVT